MFQYAAACALAADITAELKVDADTILPTHNGFELFTTFLITAPRISQKERRRLFGWKEVFVRSGLTFRYGSNFLRPVSFIKEPHYSYWSGLQHIPDDSYLYGYWQSPRYFSRHGNLVRSEFTFRNELVGDNARLAADLQNTNSVSIHVRRGDYVKNARTAQIHGACSLAYYERAIEYVSAKVANPTFFVFSDDKQWAHDNIAKRFGGRIVHGNSGDSAAVDLHLMSLAKHSIIANSTFSWWGAWLGESDESDKLVVCPDKWFNSSRLSAKDLIPARWIRILG